MEEKMYCKAREIKSDLYDIAKRLREIDSGYFLLFDYKKKRFEVHNKHQNGSSFCLALPFERLDERTLRLVRRTMASRKEQLFREMEEHNARLQKQEIFRQIKAAEQKMEDFLR
jgi:hypothetical protein